MSETKPVRVTKANVKISTDGEIGLLTFSDNDGNSASIETTLDSFNWFIEQLPQLILDAQGERALGVQSALVPDRSGPQPQIPTHAVTKVMGVGYDAGGTILEFLTHKNEPIRMALPPEICAQLSEHLGGNKAPSDSKPLVEGKTFQSETVYLDRAKYKNCTFIDCALIYTGSEWNLEGNNFQNFVINFEGAADRTLVFFQWLCVNGAQSIVETVFEQIRATRTIEGKSN